MKKHTAIAKLLCIAVILASALFEAPPAWAENADASSVKVFLDGEQIIFDVQPVILDGRTMVPCRAVFEALGYKVDWDGDSQTVTAGNDLTTISLQIGNPEIQWGEGRVTSDVTPFILLDRTLVPVRIISELSGCDVLWNGGTQTVLIYHRQAEDYTPSRFNYVSMVCDGANLYNTVWTSGSTSITAIISLDDLSVTYLPYGANDYFLYEGKLYGRFGLSKRLSYGSYDIATGDMQSITDFEVFTCYIYNDQIYFKYPGYGSDVPLYKMNMDGSNITKVVDGGMSYPVGNYTIKDDILFSQYWYSVVILPLDTLEPIDLFTLYAPGRNSLRAEDVSLSGDCLYAALTDYSDETDTQTPIGILRYNYKTGDRKLIELDQLVDKLVVTDNSIYYSVACVHGTASYDLYRADVNGGNPVLLAGEIYDWIIYGNHVYYSAGHGDSQIALARIAADGSGYQLLMIKNRITI